MAELETLITEIQANEDSRQDLQSKIQELEQVDTDQILLLQQIETILGTNVFSTPINTTQNAHQDLEIFTQVFPHINHCQTLYGRYVLQDTLNHPTANISILQQRQAIIQSLLSHQLTQILEKLRGQEQHHMWFWKQDDMQPIYDMVYFDESSYMSSITKHLNKNEGILSALNYYKIFANPTMTIMIPIITIIIPFVLMKLTGQQIPIQVFINILRHLFSAVIGNSVLLSPKAKFMTLLSTSLWVFFYLQSIYYSCSTAYYTNKIINILHQKINHIANLISTIQELLPHLPAELRSPIVEEFIRDHPLQDRLFHQEPGWLTNKGRILVTYHHFKNNLTQLIPILRWLGQIDFYVSMVTLYQEFQESPHTFQWCQYTEHKHPQLSIKAVWDPALTNNKIVTNNVILHKTRNQLITGPNAAGKSTYLKSIAICVLFAQTLTIVPAKTMRLTPFQVINTYLNIPDCTGKSSLFEAEMYRAKEHLELIETLKENEFAFVIMDEIFSSTNYVEGFSAAYSILKKLIANKRSISVITTHYADLSRLEKDTHHRIKNYKMTCQKQDGEFVFSYKLEPGVSQQYIALEILKKNDFDEQIIQDALEIAKKVVVPHIKPDDI